MLLQTAVTLIDLAARRLGLAEDDGPKQLDQAKLAIDGDPGADAADDRGAAGRAARRRCRSSRWPTRGRRRAPASAPPRGAAGDPSRSRLGADDERSGRRPDRRSGPRPGPSAHGGFRDARPAVDSPALFGPRRRRSAPVTSGAACPNQLSGGSSLTDFLTDYGIVVALVCAGAAVLYGLVTTRWLLAKSPGNEAMQEHLAGRPGGRPGLPEAPVPDHRRRRRRARDRARDRARHRDRDRLRDRRHLLRGGRLHRHERVGARERPRGRVRPRRRRRRRSRSPSGRRRHRHARGRASRCWASPATTASCCSPTSTRRTRSTRSSASASAAR